MARDETGKVLSKDDLVRIQFPARQCVTGVVADIQFEETPSGRKKKSGYLVVTHTTHLKLDDVRKAVTGILQVPMPKTYRQAADIHKIAPKGSVKSVRSRPVKSKRVA